MGDAVPINSAVEPDSPLTWRVWGWIGLGLGVMAGLAWWTDGLRAGRRANYLKTRNAFIATLEGARKQIRETPELKTVGIFAIEAAYNKGERFTPVPGTEPGEWSVRLAGEKLGESTRGWEFRLVLKEVRGVDHLIRIDLIDPQPPEEKRSAILLIFGGLRAAALIAALIAFAGGIVVALFQPPYRRPAGQFCLAGAVAVLVLWGIEPGREAWLVSAGKFNLYAGGGMGLLAVLILMAPARKRRA